MATITLAVTVVNVSGANYYFIDGARQATISAIPGNTYKFDQADSSNSGHPLRLSITSNGTHAGGSAYTDGVTTDGTPGSSGAYTQIVVDATTVQTLYYYCTQHSGMGGSFNTGSSATVQLQDRKGFGIENFSADQTSVGQIYYNTSSGQFKSVIAGVGTWSSGANTNTNRYAMGGLGSSNTAALGFGGNPSPGVTANTETWNGSAWTEVNNMNAGRYNIDGSKAGSQTSGITVGGQGLPITNKVESWDGTNWTEISEVNAAITQTVVAGTATAGLKYSGALPSNTGNTESWDNSSWTEVADLNTARSGASGAGTQTAALCFNGVGPPSLTKNESWNGSTWTEITGTNTARVDGGGCGTQIAALSMGGEAATELVNTETWDGTTWTEVNNMATAGWGFGSNGSNTSAIITNRFSPLKQTVEEWDVTDFEVKTLTTS